MGIFPRSKKEEAEILLAQLYDSVEADAGRMVITGLLGRDSSGSITPYVREIRDVLLAEGLIWESPRMSLGITEKGIAKVESARRSEILKMEIDAPYPTTPRGIKDDLEYWVRHQSDGQPGSDHWIQAQARIDHLRYLDQRSMEADEMAKRNYGSPVPTLTPEKAIKVLEEQIMGAEQLRAEPFGSSRRDEWTTTSRSVLHGAFSPGNPIFDAFSASLSISYNVHDSDAKLREIANENLDQQVGVLRSAIQQLGWNLPESTQSFLPAGSQHAAYVEIRSKVETAKSELLIIDGYVDRTLWTLLTNLSQPTKIRVLTMKVQGDFLLEAKQFVAQHGHQLEIRKTGDYHDRFLVLDKSTVWHLGASIKDAGNRAFAMSEISNPRLRSAVIADAESTWAGASTVPF